MRIEGIGGVKYFPIYPTVPALSFWESRAIQFTDSLGRGRVHTYPCHFALLGIFAGHLSRPPELNSLTDTSFRHKFYRCWTEIPNCEVNTQCRAPRGPFLPRPWDLCACGLHSLNIRFGPLAFRLRRLRCIGNTESGKYLVVTASASTRPPSSTGGHDIMLEYGSQVTGHPDLLPKWFAYAYCCRS